MSEQIAPLDLLRAVLDPVRLAVLGAASQGSVSIDDISERLGVQRREVAKSIGDLRTLGVLDKDGGLNRAALAEVGRSLPSGHSHEGEPVEGPWTADEAEILGRFFAADRLVEIPSSTVKRRLVLEKVAQEFEPGERYVERDVNFKIQLIHHDYAAIRRYMVDEGLMDRADGHYWRTGGRYEAPGILRDKSLSIPTSIDGVVLTEYDSGRVGQLVEAASDERIHRFMSDRFPHPYSMEAAEDWIDRCSAELPPNNFLIEIDGVLRGGVGAEPLSAEQSGVAEVGWWLVPEYWGRGIASASVSALVDHLFDDRRMDRLWAPVFAPNERSVGVAKNAGMFLEGRAPSAYVKHGTRHDQLNFGITREQWEAQRSA